MIIPYTNEEGKQLLNQSELLECSIWTKLERYFENQHNGSFCGIATSVITLNTLLDAKIFDQQYVYEDQVEGVFVKDKDEMRGGISHSCKKLKVLGLTLQEVGLIISTLCPSFQITVHSNSDPHILGRQFEADLIQCYHTRREQSIIVCNFWRQLDDHRGGIQIQFLNDIRSYFSHRSVRSK